MGPRKNSRHGGRKPDVSETEKAPLPLERRARNKLMYYKVKSTRFNRSMKQLSSTSWILKKNSEGLDHLHQLFTHLKYYAKTSWEQDRQSRQFKTISPRTLRTNNFQHILLLIHPLPFLKST